jgi:hypothetical protein
MPRDSKSSLWAEAENQNLQACTALRESSARALRPKASKVWNKISWSSKAYSKAFLSLKPVKASGLRANTDQMRQGKQQHLNFHPTSISLSGSGWRLQVFLPRVVRVLVGSKNVVSVWPSSKFSYKKTTILGTP